ncbi:hypothetical protein [Streptomyces prunicolor]|uniref:hypothetical protein n=1 Tax=Streptomyces prunicolor TaxID=67348 RepID=UPI000361C1DC|nr:hypothetical protein [Streptomyces prunicolor]
MAFREVDTGPAAPDPAQLQQGWLGHIQDCRSCTAEDYCDAGYRIQRAMRAAAPMAKTSA